MQQEVEYIVGILVPHCNDSHDCNIDGGVSRHIHHPNSHENPPFKYCVIMQLIAVGNVKVRLNILKGLLQEKHEMQQ